MKNKKWKEFEELTGKCYRHLAGFGEDRACWQNAYETLKQILAEERSRTPDYGAELSQLDEDTDYRCDIQGWMQDYLDEVEMSQEGEGLLQVCEELLELFQWEEDNPSDIKFLKASALGSMNRTDDRAAFCRQWLAEEPENISAVTASIYASLASGELETAGQLIKQHIREETQCTVENDILFTAASIYYQKTGNKKEKKRIDQELKKYEKFLEEFFMGGGEDEMAWGDDEFPFI